MSFEDVIAVVGIAVAILFGVAVAVGTNDERKKCEESGGVFMSSTTYTGKGGVTHTTCIAKSAVIDTKPRP